MDGTIEHLYINSKDNKCRFVLGIKGKNPLIFFGINPSTAEPERPDMTIKKIDKIAKNNNYDSWIMLNIYPQRATKPNKLDKTIDETIHKENIEAIKSNIDENSTIVAAWGNSIKKRPYLFNCLVDIVNAISNKNLTWYSIGKLSMKKNPKHPLYLLFDTKLESFNIGEYINRR